MCDNQKADCQHIPLCDPRAVCRNQGKKKGFKCVCGGGTQGNGQQCIDAEGNFSEKPGSNVEISIGVEHVFNATLP